MVAFNFKERFVLPIELGSKQQTIRNVRKRNARPGDTLQLMCGPRFNPRRIGTAECLEAGPIRLDFGGEWIGIESTSRFGHLVKIVYDGREALDQFAVRDGFQSFADMELFWIETHGERQFTGWWTFWGETFKGPLDR